MRSKRSATGGNHTESTKDIGTPHLSLRHIDGDYGFICNIFGARVLFDQAQLIAFEKVPWRRKSECAGNTAGKVRRRRAEKSAAVRGMGKRKGRKQCHAPKRPRLHEKLADRFDCPFCNDHKTVQCKSKESVSRIACSSCAAHFETPISDVGWHQSDRTYISECLPPQLRSPPLCLPTHGKVLNCSAHTFISHLSARSV